MPSLLRFYNYVLFSYFIIYDMIIMVHNVYKHCKRLRQIYNTDTPNIQLYDPRNFHLKHR